jgi:phosphonate transport system substrate-binding protein
LSKAKVWVVLGIAVLALAAGCISSEAAEALRIGLIPAEDQREMLKQYEGIIEYLEESVGMEIKPFVATDYSGVIEAMRSGKLDIAYFGPFSYVLAADVANVEAFAVPMRSDGRTTYNSIIIAHAETGIKSISDLKGRLSPSWIQRRPRDTSSPGQCSKRRASTPKRISPAWSSPAGMTL